VKTGFVQFSQGCSCFGIGGRFQVSLICKEPTLLTKRHLAIIRAALLFFDEEISPHGPNVARPYFEEPLEEELEADEVEQLRTLLRTVELRYLCCDGTETTIPSQELLTLEQALSLKDLFDGLLATIPLTSLP